MRWMDKLRLQWRSLRRRPQIDAELDDELRFHLEQRWQRTGGGLDAGEARYAARRSIGGIAQIQESAGICDA